MDIPLIGRKLARRYEVLEKVGDGGMAVVYRGRDTILDRAIAIKVLRNQYATDNEFLNRFRLEAKSAASLSHANVVNIYDVGIENGLHYIVMEYVRGENLKELIQREAPLTVEQTIKMAIEIAQALEAAHARGLIHRDIKPHNILITNQSSVKVTDFGIARATSSSSFTMTGTVIGSVHYFSPEQAKGDVVDQATDLYSLGIVMYEMLTGRLPFTGESPVAIAIKHLQTDPLPPGHFVSGIPTSIESITMRLLAKEKNNRYKNATELLQKLRELLPIYAGISYSGTAQLPYKAFSDDGVTKRKRKSRAGSRRSGNAPMDPYPSPPTDETKVFIDRETILRRHGREESAVSKKRAPHKKRKWPVLLAFFLLFFVGGVFAVTLLPDLIFPSEVDVPDIVGMNIADAQGVLDKFNLKLKEEGRTFHTEIERGKIIVQNPEAAHRVRMGREIKVVVSGGPERVIVPNLMGETKISAQLLITQERLTLGEILEEFNSDVLPNTVIGQNPLPGETVVSGKPIDIVVALSEDRHRTVRMPTVRGMQLQEAMNLLNRLGFTEGLLHGEPHPTAKENEVIDQNPQVGEEVEVGYPYSLAYAVAPDPQNLMESAPEVSPEEKHWENTLLINVPDGPAQEVVIVVVDDWGPRQVLREVRKGGSRFYHTMRLRGDLARIQVWFDGEEQLNRELRRPGASTS